jgi:hypothetical protein
MANSRYSADSAPLPPPRSLYCLFRSDVIGARRALIGDCGTAAASEALPTTPSSIG